MKFRLEKVVINRPLVLILFSVILGNLIYCIYDYNAISAVGVTALILFIYLSIFDKHYFIIGIIFIIFSIIINAVYYGIFENKNYIYNVRINKIYNDYSIGELRGRKVKVYSEKFTLNEGALIKVKGKFKKEKDYEVGIVGNVFVKELIHEKKDMYYTIKNISKNYYNLLNNYFSKGESALLTSLAFGDKDNLNYEQKQQLKELGIIHLICISGFHLNFIFAYVYKIFSLKTSLIICLIYVMITGMSPSAMRAFLMITILKSATKVYKTYDGVSALSLSAIVLLMYKPYNLYDIGFNLSYLGTLGIMLFYNTFKRILYKLPRSINSFISVSLAAQVFIYPYMILTFNTFSLNFLVSGAILTPIIGLLLPLSLLLFFFFNFNILFKIIFVATKIILLSFQGSILFLDSIIFPTMYVKSILAIIYILMFIVFYMAYNGIDKFRKLMYACFFLVIFVNYTPNISMQVYKEKGNNALIIESGFKKIAISDTKNDYFNNNLSKKFFVHEVINIQKDVAFRVGNKYILYFDKSISKPCLMLINKEYDIISLKNDEKYIISFLSSKLKREKIERLI